jgi:hypothetical protein
MHYKVYLDGKHLAIIINSWHTQILSGPTCLFARIAINAVPG